MTVYEDAKKKVQDAGLIDDNEEEITLTGYVRAANNNTELRLSINVEAFEECETYTTSDGQRFVKLIINQSNIKQVINGDRMVTTVSHRRDV